MKDEASYINGKRERQMLHNKNKLGVRSFRFFNKGVCGVKILNYVYIYIYIYTYIYIYMYVCVCVCVCVATI
jgi:hypothetical protein